MLQDIKIIDFTTLLPGPYATMIMADMGAEVINVIPPRYDDLVSSLGMKISGNSVLYKMLHRNKEVIPLDLKSSSGKEKIQTLIEDVDVLIEGFRPGVMHRLGLDYESIKQLNPDIIYCSLSGYGNDNSLEYKAGHDINYQALSGLAMANMGDRPVISHFPLADIAGGSFHAVIGILGALVHRLQVDEGQYIEISMTDCSFSLTFLDLLPQLNSHLDETPYILPQDLFGEDSFYGYYKTLDDRFLSIGSLEPKFFTSLLDVLDIDQFSLEDQFKPSVRVEIDRKIREKPLHYWIDLFDPLDICVEPVLNNDEVITSKYINERDLIVESEIDGKKFYHLAHPIKYGKYHPRYRF